jgi:flagellar hook-associated protein 3 FlgL
LTVTLGGAPNPGDTFSVTPATAPANSSLFGTLDDIIAALKTPADGNPTAKASLANAMSTGIARFQNSLSALTVTQASVGGREQQITALQTTTQNSFLDAQNNLQDVQSADMVSTISQFELTQTALQAAQQSFVKVQGLSLFQFLS